MGLEGRFSGERRLSGVADGLIPAAPGDVYYIIVKCGTWLSGKPGKPSCLDLDI